MASEQSKLTICRVMMLQIIAIFIIGILLGGAGYSAAIVRRVLKYLFFQCRCQFDSGVIRGYVGTDSWPNVMIQRTAYAARQIPFGSTFRYRPGNGRVE
jgi:hypothetical protein